MIVLDVGANDGHDTLRLAREYPDAIVHAFEPTPQLVPQIEQRCREAKCQNVFVHQIAISDEAGMMPFFVSANADWGCSSLCRFNDNLEETWPGRTDFKVTDEIQVVTKRLDSWLEENKLQDEIIGYIHVDVQGKDLEVLKSLGTCLKNVVAGVIEMPTRHHTKLYRDQQFVSQDAIDFLNQNDFTVTTIQPNDCFENEVNLSFRRI